MKQIIIGRSWFDASRAAVFQYHEMEKEMKFSKIALPLFPKVLPDLIAIMKFDNKFVNVLVS